MLQSDGSIQVAFLSYNSIEKKIDKHVVVLRRKKSEWNVEQCFPSLYDLIYDANLTRWFSITYDDDNEEMRNRIVINSGCIHEEVTSTGQNLIEFNTEVTMDEGQDVNNRIILEFDKEIRVRFADIRRDLGHINYLIILTNSISRLAVDKSITMDLIKL